MTNKKEVAEKVMNEFFDKLGPGPYHYDGLAVAAALRALVSNNEEWVDGTYMVKSEDILNIATELEAL